VGALVLIRQGMFVDAIPPDQMPLVQEQITAVFSTPLPAIMLGAVERLFALCAHLAMSLLVMQVFVRGQIRWLLASILWHTLLNASAVIAVTTWNAYVTEAIIGLFALLSIGIIFWLRTPEPVEPKLEPLPEMKPLAAVGLETTAETLERSKFT
jgi:uncharacterized membrane protein YhfC